MTPCTGWDDPVHGFSTQLIRLYTYVMTQAARVGCGLRKTLKRCAKIDTVLGDPNTVHTTETQYFSTHCNFSL